MQVSNPRGLILYLVNKPNTYHTREDSALLFSHFLQCLRDRNVLFRCWPHLTTLATLPLLLRLEVASAERAPRSKTHALVPAHWNDVTFKVAISRGPATLVDLKLTQPIIASVYVVVSMAEDLSKAASRTFVGFADDPSRGIADAEIQNFAGSNHVVE